MHDIRLIRENPDAFDAALSRRNIEPTAATILDIDSRRRRLQGEIQDCSRAETRLRRKSACESPRARTPTV